MKTTAANFTFKDEGGKDILSVLFTEYGNNTLLYIPIIQLYGPMAV